MMSFLLEIIQFIFMAFVTIFILMLGFLILTIIVAPIILIGLVIAGYLKLALILTIVYLAIAIAFLILKKAGEN